MPAGFTPADVHAIAALAQLELDEAEVELFAKQLGEILEYANRVQQIDTAGVPPTAGVVTRGHAGTADRADVVMPSFDPRDVLAAAPDGAVDAGLFRVPRVIG